MKEELEIEFKNELSYSEYSTLLKNEFENSDDAFVKTFQKNYYFDTEKQDLKLQESILRVRVTNLENELTFKVPNRGFLLETNYNLSHNEVVQIMQDKHLILSSYLTSTSVIPELNNVTKETILYLFNHFETIRFEKQVENYLIVLDHTTFKNGMSDYELEIESKDAVEGELFFDAFLKKHHIAKKISLPKIARAEINRT